MRTKRGKRVRINKGRLLLTVFVVVLLIAIAFSVKNVISLKQEQAQLEKKHAELEERKAQLEEELKNVGTLSYIEEQARKQLKLIKPGEIMYIFNNDKGSGSSNK